MGRLELEHATYGSLQQGHRQVVLQRVDEGQVAGRTGGGEGLALARPLGEPGVGRERAAACSRKRGLGRS